MRKDDDGIIVAGHICCDITPAMPANRMRMDEIFTLGKLVNIGAATISTGGPVSNTGIALHKLGMNTALMGKIGDDFLGEGVINLLEKTGVKQTMRILQGENTSYTVAVVVPGYDRIFLHCTGANDTFTADDIDLDAVKNAKLFHFGYPPLMRKMYENNGEELVKIFRAVKALGVTTSLDMSLPDPASDSGKVDWDGILRKTLPYVDIFLPSVEETMFMIARGKFDRLRQEAGEYDMLEKLDMNILPELGERLKAYGAKIAAIKCGVKGFYVTTADGRALGGIGKAKPGRVENWKSRELHEESFHVPVVASATGAGDSAIAGFLSAYMRGLDIEDAVQAACAVGGENVQTYDALSGIKTWDETITLIKDWDKNSLDIQGGYFKRHTKKGLWYGRSDALYG